MVLLGCTLIFTILVFERKESIFKPSEKNSSVTSIYKNKNVFFFLPVSFHGASISCILLILAAPVQLLFAWIITQCN